MHTHKIKQNLGSLNELDLYKKYPAKYIYSQDFFMVDGYLV